MDEDFMQYVYARCEKVLTENAEYMVLQSKCVEAVKNNDSKLYQDLNCDMECKVEELCYLQGFKDAMRMVLNI